MKTTSFTDAIRRLREQLPTSKIYYGVMLVFNQRSIGSMHHDSYEQAYRRSVRRAREAGLSELDIKQVNLMQF